MKDKIIIWLDSSLAYFGLVKSLQENYDCDLFSIIDVPDKPKEFFEKQQLVKFQKFWFYHDYVSKLKQKPDIEYLKSFEKKYGINLWLLAFNDRLLFQNNDYYKFTTDEILSVLENECKLFESILDEVNPNFVIMYEPFTHHDQLFYELCKAKQLITVILTPSRFGYRCIISDKICSVDGIGYPSIKHRERTDDELREFLNRYSISKQGTDIEKRYQSSKGRKMINAVLHFLFSQNSNSKTHYTYFGRTKLKVLIKTAYYFLRIKYREFYMNKNLDIKIDEDLPIISFFLATEIENSLLIHAPFYTNQIEMIKNIIKSIPVGYRLYVKEHPYMYTRGWREISYYKEIMKLPNVKLLHYSVKSEDLIKKSSLVIAVSGTVALEAAFYGKPAVLFADTSFSMLPSITRVKVLEDLPSLIRTSLENKVRSSDLNEYVNVVEENSFEFDYHKILSDVEDFFHHGGFLADSKIDVEIMQEFLERNKSEFTKLAIEHIKKIQEYRKKKT